MAEELKWKSVKFSNNIDLGLVGPIECQWCGGHTKICPSQETEFGIVCPYCDYELDLNNIREEDMCQMDDPYRCPCCGGLTALDYTYLDQVGLYTVCPYCYVNLIMPDPDNDFDWREEI